MTCKTCKYWERVTDCGEDFGGGDCKHPFMTEDPLTEEQSKVYDKWVIYPDNPEAMEARYLTTSENFGCINWEEI